MSTDLMPFVYNDQSVRVVLVESEPWFVLADLCTVLGLSNPSMVADRIESDALSTTEVIDSMGRTQQARIVSEPGMYEVIFLSRKSEARDIKRWITRDVLPSIRRTGQYGAANHVVELPSKRELAQWVVEAEDRADREHAARVEAEQYAKSLEAPAASWTHLAAAEGDFEVGDAAKVLSRDPNILIGRDRLFTFMSDNGWIYRSPSTGRWQAYQVQVNIGRLREKIGKPYLHVQTGQMRAGAPTIRVTARGLHDLHKLLGGSEQLALLGVVSA